MRTDCGHQEPRGSFSVSLSTPSPPPLASPRPLKLSRPSVLLDAALYRSFHPRPTGRGRLAGSLRPSKLPSSNVRLAPAFLPSAFAKRTTIYAYAGYLPSHRQRQPASIIDVDDAHRTAFSHREYPTHRLPVTRLTGLCPSSRRACRRDPYGALHSLRILEEGPDEQPDASPKVPHQHSSFPEPTESL
ncbi:hypothetical protein FA13DRAFT_1032128 [Coprinellus micaceus]|uniref:Uncharacterized protein n=1 Tax=Coprinellus micaceus TaxID=71717 RepID=A0A4Y7RNJ1_COPMI|nr:hypothetical protein FA13DRAFT_1032128 [Coprinellus micaceus]